MTELREVFLARRREENGAVPRQNAGQALVAYINSNLAGDLSLDALSDRFYLSKSQLGRLFKQATGSSIWEYVLIKRLPVSYTHLDVYKRQGVSMALTKKSGKRPSSTRETSPACACPPCRSCLLYTSSPASRCPR